MRAKANDPISSRSTWAEAKDAILDIIAVAGGVLNGKVRLHKAFYAAHLFYWRDNETGGVLTAHPIVRLPHGPFIDDAERILHELVVEGSLTLDSAPAGPFEESVYKLQTKRVVDRHTPRGRAIYQAVDFALSRSASELSDLTHEHSVSWQNTQNGHEQSIYLDVLPAEELEAMRRLIREEREHAGLGV